jgi:hypothetical protein
MLPSHAPAFGATGPYHQARNLLPGLHAVPDSGSPIGTMPISPEIYVVAPGGVGTSFPLSTGQPTLNVDYRAPNRLPSCRWSNPTMNPRQRPQSKSLRGGDQQSSVNNGPNITRFLRGTLTVTDYAAVRK